MERTTGIGIGVAAAAILVFVLAILVFVLAILVIDGTREDVIGDGVRIGTVDVGGLSRDEARSLVQRKLAGAVGEPVTATHERRRFVLRPGDVKARLDADASVDAALSRGRAGDPFSR
ncbi:MAG: hypothetical protein ACRDLN_11435, partial [Solirubrobacteraceae bacterium]